MYPRLKEYTAINRETTMEDTNWLFSNLKTYGQLTVLAWLMSPEPHVKNIPTVEEIVMSKEFAENSCQADYLLGRLKVG